MTMDMMSRFDRVLSVVVAVRHVIVVILCTYSCKYVCVLSECNVNTDMHAQYTGVLFCNRNVNYQDLHG